MYASYCQSKNMVLLLNLILFCYLGMSFGSNDVTEILHKNVLLNRRKRYLIFPKGSNLAVSVFHKYLIYRFQMSIFFDKYIVFKYMSIKYTFIFYILKYFVIKYFNN